MKIRTGAIISITALALALAAGAAKGEIIYNNFGSNDAYVAFSPFASALGTGNSGLAAPFTPTNRAALGSITVAMAQNAGTGPVRLTVRTDDGGVPGTNILEAFDASGFASGTGSVGTVVSTQHPILHPGVTYWIAAELTVPGDVYQWHGAGVFAVGRAYDAESDGIDGWVADLESSHALRVEGRSVSDFEWLVALVVNSDLPAKYKQSLLVTLRAARRAFHRGDCRTAKYLLEAFQNKVRAQVARRDPDFAALLIQTAQTVADAPCAPSRAKNR